MQKNIPKEEKAKDLINLKKSKWSWEQFVNIKGYESFAAYLKAKEKLSGNTPEEQFLYKEGYKTFEAYLKAKGYKGLPTVNIQGDDINNTTFYLFNDIQRAHVNIGNTTINTINNQIHNYLHMLLTYHHKCHYYLHIKQTSDYLF